MKELSIAEKAKRYDEAIYRAKKMFSEKEVNFLFPELTESEDERIKKEIRVYFATLLYDDNVECPKQESLERWIAWLENTEPKFKAGDKVLVDGKVYTIKLVNEDNYIVDENGRDVQEHFSYTKDWKLYEQNSADKIGSKFKVGDWIVYKDTVWKVCNISLLNYYELLKINNEVSTRRIEDVDKNARPWTIRDAKEGDILIDKSNSRECPFIFKETKPSNIKTDVLNPLTVLGYCGIGGAGFTKSSGWGDTANCTYYPAIKEQYDQLERAIADAGYTFDFEKKELREIEKKSSWSEDDESTINDIICYIRQRLNYESEKGKKKIQKCENWLKFLKDRYTWKPSKGQLECLGYAIEKAEKNWSPLINNRIYLTLKALKEQLEKL